MVQDENRRPIVLIGLMGAGKTSVGRRLAEQLNWPFVDSDDEIESAAGCTIADIFDIYGEPAFRDVERRVLERLLAMGPSIIATGGGAFINEDIRGLIKDQALSVWLQADLDLLVARTAGRTHRPLLNAGDPREILGRLIDQRYPIYAEADITIHSHDESINETVDKILRALPPINHRLNEDPPS